MPSLVNDKAVSTAKEKVDNLSPQIKQSPKKLAPSSSPLSRRRHPDYSSPLFREEVVQQEMRYFDEVLRADDKVGGCGYNLPAYKPSFFGERVKEGSKHNNSSLKQRQSSSPNRSNTSSLPKSYPRHQQQQQRSKKRHVRSRNIRQQTNRKLLLKAKVSSRRIMRKLSGIGQTCSKKWDAVANAIHHRILLSIASMNSLLENSGVSNSDYRQRRSFRQEVVVRRQHRESSTSHHNVVQTNHGDNSSNRGIQPRAPPQLFMDTTTWLKNRTESISSKAIAKAKDSIRNRNVSFIV